MVAHYPGSIIKQAGLLRNIQIVRNCQELLIIIFKTLAWHVSGLQIPAMLLPSAWKNFIRVTQSDGYIVFNTQAETFAQQVLKSKLDELTPEGRWLVEQSPVCQSYYLDEPEVTSQVFVFKLIQVLNLVLRFRPEIPD